MGILALVFGVVVAVERVEFPLILTDGFEFFDQLVGLALGGVDLAVVASDAVDCFKDQDRVGGDEGAAGFRDDVCSSTLLSSQICLTLATTSRA